MPDPLVNSFGNAARPFAAKLRELLPVTLFGTPAEQAKARQQLQQMADQTSLKLKAASRAWLKSKTIESAVVKGQKQVVQQLNATFGGVNLKLVEQLSREVAVDLSRAAASPRPFLAQTLRQTTAWGARHADTVRDIADLDLEVSRSLLRGALEQRTWKQASKDLLEDLGLDRGDKVLFLSGRKMGAAHYAKLVTRTRTMEALNRAKAEELQDRGYEFIITSAHEGVDERDICFFLQGKVWALQENNLGIPVLPEEYGLPPWHPNCRHTFGAWQPKFESEKDIAKAIEEHEGDEEDLESWDGKVYKK